MKRYFLLMFCIFCSCHLFSQSVYTWGLQKDLIIGSVALGLSIAPFFIDFSSDDASMHDSFQKENVNAFDRGMIFAYNKPLAIFSDVTLYALMAAPIVSLAGNIKDANVWVTYGIMYAETFLLVYGTTEIAKDSILRYRPYCYLGDIPSGKENDYFKSFPSRHTALAFMSAGFLTTTFFTEYPDSSWKIPVSAIAYTLAAGVGAGRIISGSHFLTDVLAGAAIGSVYGWLIPALHIRAKSNTAIQPVVNGIVVKVSY
ncbi:phosphatase PAP2 family protein [Breznakiellaceae bacterium SP9]